MVTLPAPVLLAVILSGCTVTALAGTDLAKNRGSGAEKTAAGIIMGEGVTIKSK